MSAQADQARAQFSHVNKAKMQTEALFMALCNCGFDDVMLANLHSKVSDINAHLKVRLSSLEVFLTTQRTE